MKGLLTAIALACVPACAAALSCTPHSVEQAYAQAQADAGRFVIVQGRLDFDVSQLPKKRRKLTNNAKTTVIKARLTGSSLSASGFSTPYSKPVNVILECYGPWCASMPRGGQVLAFVSSGAQGRIIATNPCGGYLFDNPTTEMLRGIKSCFAGGSCTPAKTR